MADEKKEEIKLIEEAPVITDHSFGGIKAKVHAGRLPLKNDEGGIDANVFFIAYIKESDKPAAERPLMFVFNGGPGSPSIWLHLGAVGPKRAPMLPDGNLPAPPYTLQDNPHHWLDMFDLVFIDPVGTGYSRAKDEKTAEKYWGLKGDLESVGEFIRLFLVRHNRSASPLYMCGESYGTTRAAGLAGLLVDKGIAFSGIVLVSSVLNFQTLEFRKGNDLPYPLFLPTYAATAHYHGKVTGSLDALLAEAREFALGAYWTALAKGSRLAGAEREAALDKLSRLTGLDRGYLDRCDLRPRIGAFCKELMRTERRTVGRLDSRIRGYEDSGAGNAESMESDPSMSILMPPYTSLFAGYAREQLGYESDLEYTIFSGIKKPWDWGSAREGYPDTSEALRKSLSRFPHTKVLVASGLYDLATPFFATEYTLDHMGLAPELASAISVKEYEAGHMMYIHEGCLARLKSDVADWAGMTG